MPVTPSLALSVVIPTINEGTTLPSLLDDLAPLVAEGDVEILVADGGSGDGTRAIATARGARVVASGLGRGRQLRAGVAEARAPALWVLHADARVPATTSAMVARCVRDGLTRPYACRLAIQDDGWPFRLIEAGANLRSRAFALPYGDQGLLVPRAVLDRAGGYDDIPLMEDVALALRLRRISPIGLLPVTVEVSARRWHRDGPWRRSARNLWLLLRFLAGADPVALAEQYRPPAPARPNAGA